MSDQSKNLGVTGPVPKKTGHRFAHGNTYGKNRPEGSRNSATIALQALLEDEGEAITRKAIELAKGGSSVALRLVLERLIPPTREPRVNLNLPKVETAEGVTAAIGAVLEAVAGGLITPGEGQALAALLESQRKSIETCSIERRVSALEEKSRGSRFMSNLQTRVQRLEASEESGSEAMRAPLEKFAGKLGIDLTRPGVRQVLEDAFRAGTIDRERMVTWEEFTRIFDRLTELARGGL